MDTKKAYLSLCQVAKNRGISVQLVIDEIERAINESIEKAERENDRRALDAWRMIPCAADRPTALKLVSCLGQRVHDGHASLFDI